jgi:hypothetical protein
MGDTGRESLADSCWGTLTETAWKVADGGNWQRQAGRQLNSGTLLEMERVAGRRHWQRQAGRYKGPKQIDKFSLQ